MTRKDAEAIANRTNIPNNIDDMDDSTPTEAPKKAQTEKSTTSPQKAQNETNTDARGVKKTKQTKKETHRVVSFWVEKGTLEKWQCYQTASNDLKYKEDLYVNAVQEYIANHPLEGAEQTAYTSLLKSRKS